MQLLLNPPFHCPLNEVIERQVELRLLFRREAVPALPPHERHNRTHVGLVDQLHLLSFAVIVTHIGPC
jgi:hypothetical protein